MVGGYGKLGAPFTLLNAMQKVEAKDLTVVCGVAACTSKLSALRGLLEGKKVKKLITSNIQENELILDLFKKGELEIQLEPMGTLAEKVRSGGFGIPAFYSHIGIGTFIENGGVPTKLAKNGKTILAVNLAKQKRMFNGKECLLEKTISGDYSLVKAWKADAKGNCVLKLGNRNFNPDMATSGKVCIVEADEIVEVGALDGDDIHIPGIFVHKVVKSVPMPHTCMIQACPMGTGEVKAKRELMAKRAAQELKEGAYVVLGNGLPKAVEHYMKPELDVHFVIPETGILGGRHLPLEERTGFAGDLLDGALQPQKLRKNACIVKASDGFAGLRGNHMDLFIVDGFQVSEEGDLANIQKAGEVLPSPGVNIDLATSGTKVVVLMEMATNGKPNLVKSCNLKVSGKKCVSKLITDMGVFEFRAGKLTLVEVAEGVTPEQVKNSTPCSFKVAADLKKMAL
jgi:3-oxoacid CoA-transferase